MRVSRRSLCRVLGTGAVFGAAAGSFSATSFGDSSRVFNEGSAERTIYLDHNENAYGPSEKVLVELGTAPSICNRYPRTEYDSLVNKLAAAHAVTPQQIALGCGSSEILQLAAAEFLGPGKNLVQALPTYPALARLARSYGADVVEVPLTKRHEHNLDAMLSRVNRSTGLVYICNPNNPTGTLTARKDIVSFIAELPRTAMVLIDEAYHHFVIPHNGYASLLDQPVGAPRLMVARTFSKIYGIAGLRIGYVVAATEVVRSLSAHQSHFGISVVSARAALAALDDLDYIRLAAKRNTDDRQEFMNQCNARMLGPMDSQTNFLMINPLRPADQFVAHLKTHGVLVGPLVPAMPKLVRVSLGTPDEMKIFWSVVDLLPPTGKMAM